MGLFSKMKNNGNILDGLKMHNSIIDTVINRNVIGMDTCLISHLYIFQNFGKISQFLLHEDLRNLN